MRNVAWITILERHQLANEETWETINVISFVKVIVQDNMFHLRMEDRINTKVSCIKIIKPKLGKFGEFSSKFGKEIKNSC